MMIRGTPGLTYELAVRRFGAPGARPKAYIQAGLHADEVPGMLAALTILPVLGVPVESRVLRGVDSLLSIVQMPKGIPVGTLAIGAAGAANAGLLAAAILARHDPALRDRLADYRAKQTADVSESPQ